ncbi:MULTISPECIES: DUF485 domain-containing protein [unclassified Streptomyces]|uniref:DUF485 domain-containing protein n=1 Tax=unclassified Streptomyces TaxID=2593676 RepID=UPI00093CF4B3|nr:DUF485 domain-containing protein [Streptomyces sp. CB01883]OKJ80974.1 hypothetical protein AMK32_25105 [Streptomyces sp. CB01883]
MTFPDDSPYPYPPPAGPGWPRPQAEPPARDPWGASPGWQAPYGPGVPQDNAYTYDVHRPDPYGQTPRHRPSASGADRHGGDLDALRSAYRVLRRVSTLTALGSFVVYVLLSCWAPDLMGAEITHDLSLGMALGVLQLVVTFAAVLWYGRSAERSVDPLARAVRERAVPRTDLEGGAAR